MAVVVKTWEESNQELHDEVALAFEEWQNGIREQVTQTEVNDWIERAYVIGKESKAEAIRATLGISIATG